ncbi:putative membrane protein [Bacteriovorax sp. BSW11_IV]|uniref:hypothetical protein n=1 Tax=Bacteriovorax sp. BSW11_IV TaxID=1353529 RepID=UPI00038A53FF|nr:hypothetical protein [Bacteriovorax sp. BSW11_IV]EQC47938.1 putative membrane protein [Bacteriovorax sp. BSW11_IV]
MFGLVEACLIIILNIGFALLALNSKKLNNTLNIAIGVVLISLNILMMQQLITVENYIVFAPFLFSSIYCIENGRELIRTSILCSVSLITYAIFGQDITGLNLFLLFFVNSSLIFWLDGRKEQITLYLGVLSAFVSFLLLNTIVFGEVNRINPQMINESFNPLLGACVILLPVSFVTLGYNEQSKWMRPSVVSVFSVLLFSSFEFLAKLENTTNVLNNEIKDNVMALIVGLGFILLIYTFLTNKTINLKIFQFLNLFLMIIFSSYSEDKAAFIGLIGIWPIIIVMFAWKKWIKYVGIFLPLFLVTINILSFETLAGFSLIQKWILFGALLTFVLAFLLNSIRPMTQFGREIIAKN